MVHVVEVIVPCLSDKKNAPYLSDKKNKSITDITLYDDDFNTTIR